MYHPYLHVEAKRIVKERGEAADLARRADQARGGRPSLLSRMRAWLAVLVERSTIWEGTGRKPDGGFDTPLPVVREE